MLEQLFELLTLGTLVLLVATQNEQESHVCTSERCAQTAKMFLQNMDLGMLPCHNFHDFMCGNFPKWYPLKSFFDRQNSFSIRERYVNEKLLRILNSNEDKSSIGNKIRTFYQDCMDEATIEELGSTTVPLELNAVGLPVALPLNPALIEPSNLSRLLGRLHRRASYAKFLFDAEVTADLDDGTKNYLSLNGISPTSQFWNDEWSKELEVFAIRSRVSSQEEKTKTKEEMIKEKGREFMKKTVLYMSDIANERYSEKSRKRIENRIEKVMEFLEKLQETIKLPNLFGEATKTTVIELQKKTDEILEGSKSQIKKISIVSPIQVDTNFGAGVCGVRYYIPISGKLIIWLDYLETLFENIRDDTRKIFEEGEPILIGNMKQLEAVLRILATVDQKVFLSAMWFIVTRSVSPYASRELRRIYYDYEIQIRKVPVASRQNRCLNIVKNQFPFFLGIVMVSADENATEDQNKAFEMLANLKTAFQDTIINCEWLDTSTKMATLNKLQYIRQSISFEKWMLVQSEIESLYSDKTVIPKQFFTSLRLMKRCFRDQNLAYLTIDNDIYSEMPPPHPGDVNAYYAVQSNGINIPIGILGPPFYSLGLEALNYGAIGVVIGHELGHAFDSFGKNYNSWGMKKQWWKKRTNTEYDKRADCFVKSYDDIFIPEVERKVNGKLTINENIADYLGFTQALKAYRLYVEKHGKEKRLPHFEHYSDEKLFTMAYANMYCEASTPGLTKWLLEYDVHAPKRARILGVLRNSADFADIWKCSDESQMNPKDKCKIW